MSNELRHYGVIGMKWGRRRGGLRERFTGAMAERNQQEAAILNRMKKNDGTQTFEEKFNRKISVVARLGEKRLNKFLDKRLSDISAQNERIASGKMTMRDKFQGLNTVSMLDLMVSRRDNKG